MGVEAAESHFHAVVNPSQSLCRDTEGILVRRRDNKMRKPVAPYRKD
jgi:hypothetical protein